LLVAIDQSILAFLVQTQCSRAKGMHKTGLLLSTTTGGRYMAEFTRRDMLIGGVAALAASHIAGRSNPEINNGFTIAA
jgi:hypothetical protein